MSLDPALAPLVPVAPQTLPVTAATPGFRKHHGYGLALALVIGLGVALLIGSAVDIPFSEGGSALNIAALVVSGLVAGLTWAIVRIFGAHAHDSKVRHRRLIIAGAAFGIVLVLGLAFNVALYAQFNVAALLACLPFTGFGLWVLRRVERNRREPWRLVLVAIGWGMIIAPTFALLGESLYSALFTSHLSSAPAHGIAEAFSAALFEEAPKGMAVVLLFLVFRTWFDDIVSGIVFGAAVGMGFNLSESMLYMHHGFLGQLWLRQVWGLFTGHTTYSALIGAGIGVARQQRGLPRRALAIVSGFVIAIAAHFTWDAIAFLNLFPSSGDNVIDLFVLLPVQTVLIDGPFFVLVVLGLLLGLRSEGRALRAQMHLEAETGSGAILPDEVPILASPRLRARFRRQALFGKGIRRYRWLTRLQRAQMDLAMERWHRARQELDEPMEAEEALRRHVLELRYAPAG